jgi:hypothetical protein
MSFEVQLELRVEGATGELAIAFLTLHGHSA